MNITAKSRYALKIMMDLADFEQNGHQQRHKIADRQGIPVDFMDHILARLRGSQLIESIRGRTGGFKLNRPPEQITLWDIFHSVEESIYSVRCMTEGEPCLATETCISHDAWTEVYGTIKSSLESKSLKNLVDEWQTKKSTNATQPCYPAQVECRGPLKQASSSPDRTRVSNSN